MMEQLDFLHPLGFLAVVPVCLGLWTYRRQRRRQTVLFSATEPLQQAPKSLVQKCRPLVHGLRVLGLLLLVTALARPRHGLEEFRIRTEGISIMMGLDRSESMKALDFEQDGKRIDRLTVVKNTFRDFVAGNGELDGRRDDRIGLIAFTGYPESLCPLTLDHGTLLHVLDGLDFPEPLVDQYGRVVDEDLHALERSTAIGDALARGIERLRGIDSKSKVLILLSDGENTAGAVDPRQAARIAKEHDIKIYTIGVGSTGTVPFPQYDRYGELHLRQVRLRLDEGLLTEVAEITGGKYFNAEDRAALREVYAAIDELEKTEREGFLYTEYRELFPFCLIPATILLVLEFFLRTTRFATLP